MNNLTLTGRVCNVPKIRVLNVGGKTINICNFTIAVADGLAPGDKYSQKNLDFFECVCFNESALALNANFIKGAKISCAGKLKNHFFEDANRTKHFTQVIVVLQVEYGDTASVFDKNVDGRKAVDMSIVNDFNEVMALYDLVCDHGYLVIDEDDYYKIAMDNYML